MNDLARALGLQNSLSSGLAQSYVDPQLLMYQQQAKYEAYCQQKAASEQAVQEHQRHQQTILLLTGEDE